MRGQGDNHISEPFYAANGFTDNHEYLHIIYPSGKYTKKSIVLLITTISVCSFLTGTGIAFFIKLCYENALRSKYYPPSFAVAVGVLACILGSFSGSLCGRVILREKIRNPRIVYWSQMFCLILAYICTLYVWENLNLFNDGNFLKFSTYHPRGKISELSWFCFFFVLINYMGITIQRVMRNAETPFSEENNCWLIKTKLSKAIPWLTNSTYKKINMRTIQFHDLLQEHTAINTRTCNAKLFILKCHNDKAYKNLVLIEYSTQREWWYFSPLTYFFRRVTRQVVWQLNDNQFGELVRHFGPIVER